MWTPLAAVAGRERDVGRGFGGFQAVAGCGTGIRPAGLVDQFGLLRLGVLFRCTGWESGQIVVQGEGVAAVGSGGDLGLPAQAQQPAGPGVRHDAPRRRPAVG
jgi:hypothetical protein